MSNEAGYRDRTGAPIDVQTWGRLWEDPAYRFVERTALVNGRTVITVWEGVISPVVAGLFFTAAFDRPTGQEDLGPMLEELPSQDEPAALVAHEAAVARWSSSEEDHGS